MFRILVLGAASLALPAAARAQEPPQPVRIVITKVDCSRLIRHVPAPDVAYQPGVDVRGREVASADLPGTGADALPNLLPDVLEFPLTINPVSYGARNQAQREKAAANKAVTDSYNDRTAAQAQVATLTTQKAGLTTQAATLATEKTALETQLSDLNTSIAQMKTEIAAGTRNPSDREYQLAKLSVPDLEKKVADKKAAITANTNSLSTTEAALSAASARQAAAEGSPAKLDAQAQVAALTAQKTTLTNKGATLAAEKLALDNTLSDLNRDLTTMKGEIAAGTRTPSDREYTLARLSLSDVERKVAAKQAAIDANNTSLAATNAAITAQQTRADNSPDRATANAAAVAAADAKLAALSSKGLDSTTMQVGTVRYDMAKGIFTFNGEPIGGAEQQELAQACRKQGVR